MGAELSLMAPTASSIAVSAYVDVLKEIQYRKQLGPSRFLKAIKATDTQGEIVVKVFIKPNDGMDLSQWSHVLQSYKSKLLDVPSVVPYTKIIESDRAGYLIRQFVKSNVYDRISTRPFLTDVEKKWIVFQLLNTVKECHERGVTHGDIKTENILVTSWNWILLTDFAPFKPIYLPEDNPGIFSFYFDTSQRRTCYLAPERFLNTKNVDDQNGPSSTVTKEMDIFGLGCAIAEIFLEGLPIFTLSQLYKYKKGEFDPDLTGIVDPQIRELINSMINRDPKLRLSAKDYLEKFREKVFPNNFHSFLYEYFKSLNERANSPADIKKECDSRINKLYNDFDKISFFLDLKYEVDDTINDDRIGFENILPLRISLPGVPKDYKLKSTSHISTNETALLLLSLTCTSIRNVLEESSKIRGLELILALSERINDESKLDRSLPYIISLFNDSSDNVQAAALETLTQLLLLIDAISPVNALVFPEYIIPRLSTLLRDASSYVKMCFATCLPFLAQTCLRFYDMFTILKSNVLEASIDSETVNGNLTTVGIFEFPKESLTVEFESFAISILTDPQPMVRIALLKQILPLCSFFGKDKVNDLILSHLITYLNDRNPALRIAFVEAVVGLSIYVGTTSLEHYILPLLVQTLTDPEELVVIKVLYVFKDLFKLGLIKKDFVWDLLSTVIKLLLHPNEWIRQAVLLFVATIAESLSLADLYCILYPIIRPHIEYDITDFQWNTLQSACKRSLSRSVYNLASTWSLRCEETLFWKQGDEISTDNFGNRGLGFIKNGDARNKKVFSISYGNLEIPLSQEDKLWVDRLITSGLGQSELWKIADLREYIYRVSRLTSRSTDKDFEAGSVQIQDLGVLPRNVFFDSKHDTGGLNHNVLSDDFVSADDRLFTPEESFNDASSDATRVPQSLTDTFSRSLAIGSSKAAPSIITNEENAYGQLELSFQKLTSKPNKVSPSTIVSSALINSYTGDDPYIIRFLNSVGLDPLLEEYPEFHNNIKAYNSSINRNWIPKGELVSHLTEHKSCINTISISPDHTLFITGDDHGCLKVWDSSKLERNTTNSSILSIELDSAITKIKFLDTYESFGITTKDGYVRIMSVDHVRNTKKSSKSVSGLTIIRETQLEESYIVDFTFGHKDERSILYGITSTSEIVGIDFTTMKQTFKLQNNPLYGLLTTFTVDNSDNWLLIGTNKGVLNLWDLRFKIHLKSWRFKAEFGIRKVQSCSNDFHLNRKKGRFVSIIGGTGASDVSIFDVSTGNIREIYTRSTVNNFDKFGIVELKEGNYQDENWHKLDSLDNKEEDEALTAMELIEMQIENRKKFWILTGTPTYEMVLWNIYHPEDSKVLLNFTSSHSDQGAPTFSSSQINPTLRIVTEKYPTVSDIQKNDKVKKRRKTKGLMSEEQEHLIKGHHDIITDVAFLKKPYEMIVSVDRSGTLNVYK